MRWILIVLLIFLIGLQYRLWIGPGSWAHIVVLERKINQQDDLNRQLSERNKLLETDVHSLKNGLQGVEDRARTELGLIRDDEIFYLLVDKKND
ncbi:MAG: cell division protein FtsB [Paraglaciecola psychrophila]|jgi:cell division protein FtsB